MLLACTASTTATDVAQTVSGRVDPQAAPRIAGPDVVLTTPLQPLDVGGLAGRHAAFPSLAARPGGDLMLAWRSGTDHVNSRDGEIVTATSTNLGGSYSDPTTVLDGNTDYRDASLSTINGELWMTYFTGSASNSAQGVYIVRGDGSTVRIDNLPYAAISAPVVALPYGDLGTVYYGHAAGEQLDSAYFAWSSDGGTTWSSTRIADGPKDGRHYQEPWLVVRNGTLHVLHRYGSWDSIGIVSSSDNGTHWTTPRKILGQATGRPTTLVYSSGTMVVVYRHTGTRAAVAAVSRDGGTTWRPTGTLLTPPAGSPLGMTYAAMVQIVPGVAHLVVAAENADGSSVLYGGWLAEATR
jgi:hypothetical protein